MIAPDRKIRYQWNFFARQGDHTPSHESGRLRTSAVMKTKRPTQDPKWCCSCGTKLDTPHWREAYTGIMRFCDTCVLKGTIEIFT